MVRAKGMSDSHIRFCSMGPFRYVRLERRFHLFSSTDAPNPLGRVLFLATIQKTNPTTRVGLIFGAGEGNRTLVFSLGS